MAPKLLWKVAGSYWNGKLLYWKNKKRRKLTIVEREVILGRFLLVRTGRPGRHIWEQYSAVCQICPVKSVNSQILHTVVMDFWENFVANAHSTFKSTGPTGQLWLMESALVLVLFETNWKNYFRDTHAPLSYFRVSMIPSPIWRSGSATEWK